MRMQVRSGGASIPLTTDSNGNPAGSVVVKDRPAYPSQNYLIGYSVAGTAGGDVLYTSPDVSGYNHHLVENRSGETVDVFVTADGTFNASQPAAGVVLTDSLTGDTVTSLTIPANKSGKLSGKYKNIRVDQNGAGAPAVDEIVITHGVI